MNLIQLLIPKHAKERKQALENAVKENTRAKRENKRAVNELAEAALRMVRHEKDH